ncbi:flagellar basal-body rod protein FlgB [Tindallia magadiensis]|uniref:Flagellar basal body rod protein FlgB n=1 Tax=Tindallia magadiensis TaxID=69895 RepID=A0A1I3AK83_9FIRM|nr:flagellar basal body rod protein FlgB [Tindallia magadiensis]SFH50467.1 flagellar basal-body rod protein FlgB [Tindallia magadiensis]
MNNTYRNVDVLSRAMDASWARNESISNNIANVNTPGFKKTSVEFESIMKDVINNNKIPVKLTHQKHIPIGSLAPESVTHQKKQRTNFSTRRDGNNVDIDVEMAERAKNELWYQTLSTRINGEFHKLRTVISEGSR